MKAVYWFFIICLFLCNCTDPSVMTGVTKDDTIIAPKVMKVPTNKINGYYKVIALYTFKGKKWSYYSTPNVVFPDTIVKSFYKIYLHVDNNVAECISYFCNSSSLQTTYSYSIYSIATLIWRYSVTGDSWVIEFNWKSLNSSGSVIDASMEYVNFDDIFHYHNYLDQNDEINYHEVIGATQCDNSTRYKDSEYNDPVYYTEYWERVDSTEYYHFRKKAKFY